MREEQKEINDDNVMEEPKSAIRSMETSHKPRVLLRCKVVVVGDAHVGKTALVQMFHSGGHNFPKNYVMTLNTDFCVKVVNIPDTNASVELFLHDSAGQSVFNQREMGSPHWDNASVVMVAYDVCSRESFQSCAKWLSAVRGTQEGRPLPGVLVSTKNDLREQGRMEVSSQEGEAFAQRNGLTFFETYAARNTEVDSPFHFVADAFHKKYLEFKRNVEYTVG